MNTDVEELDLSDNAFGPIGVPGFGPYLDSTNFIESIAITVILAILSILSIVIHIGSPFLMMYA